MKNKVYSSKDVYIEQLFPAGTTYKIQNPVQSGKHMNVTYNED